MILTMENGCTRSTDCLIATCPQNIPQGLGWDRGRTSRLETGDLIA